jgi:peptidylamidoglycolate lyase
LKVKTKGTRLLPHLLSFLVVAPLALAQQNAQQACQSVTSYNEIQELTGPVAAAVAGADAGEGRGRGQGGRGGRGARPEGPLVNGYPAGRGNSKPEITLIPKAPMLPYKAVDPPPPPAGTTWGNLGAVGFLSNGDLLVYNRKPQFTLVEYDAGGRLVRSIDENIAGRPHGMRIDKNDNIWITDVACHTVMKLNSSGGVLLTIGTKGQAGTWDEAAGKHFLNQPTDIGFGKNGDIFVSTGHGQPDPMVLRFDKNGKYITSWPMKRPEGASIVHSVMVDKDGNVMVTERDFGIIDVFDPNGKRLRELHFQNLTCTLYIDSKGQLWTTTGFDGMILRLDWDGKVIGWMGQSGPTPLDFTEAHSMAISADMKTIYAADSAGAKLHKFVATN